jgi:hypothetical protein
MAAENGVCNTTSNRCAPGSFPGGWVGLGANLDSMYNLCLILKIMLYKSCCKYNITVPATAFLYI